MKNLNKTRAAVLYTRVSTEEQVSNTSLASQLEACVGKAEALSLPIILIHSDPGVSGGLYQSRPGVQAAIRDIEAGRADTLICYDLDRLSRVVKHQQDIKERIEKAGGHLVFCTQDFAENEEGDLQYAMTGTFKAYEKQVFRRRTMNGRLRAAKEGRQPARGWSPYGYIIPKKNDIIAGRFAPDQIGKYLINEQEAATVRWLFHSYAAGEYSLPGLARELNQRGIPTKMGAAEWHPPTIRGFFLNTVYIGQPKYGRLTCRKDEGQLSQVRPSTGEFFKTPEVRRPTAPEDVLTLDAPPIVDQATFDRVQERLATNKAKRGGNPCRTHMLSGRAVCETCGSPMVMHGGKPQKGYPSYYSCGRHKQGQSYTGESACTGKEAFKVPVAEGATVRAIEQAATHPEWVQAALAGYRENQPAPPIEDTQRELAAIERGLNLLAQDEAAAVQAQIAGIRAGASPNAYSAVFADLATKRKELEGRSGIVNRAANTRRPAGAATERSDDEVTAQVLADVSLILRSESVPEMEKRQAVGLVVEKVYCRRDGAIVTFAPGLFGGDTLQDHRISFF